MNHEPQDSRAREAGTHENYVAPRAEDVGAPSFPVEVAPGAPGSSFLRTTGTRT